MSDWMVLSIAHFLKT